MKTRLILLSGVMAWVCSLGFGGGYSLMRTLNDPTVTGGDQFGTALVIDGHLLLIGAPRDSTQGDTVGQAHLVDLRTGSLVRTFNDPTPTAVPFGLGDGDRFGLTVALDSGRALIGAPVDDSEGDNFGQAYLFDVETGDLLMTFNEPSPASTNHFGSGVALDGERIFVGAFRSDDGVGPGRVYLFDGSSGEFIRAFDDPTPGRADAFGLRIAASDGRVLIGAPQDETSGEYVGQAHLFSAATGELLHTFDDPTPSMYGGDDFGAALALEGDRVVVGARSHHTAAGLLRGQAHVFDAESGELLRTFDDPTPSMNLDGFGLSVALDGDLVLVGAGYHSGKSPSEYAPSIGDAHLFDLETGELLRTFDHPAPMDLIGGEFFGVAVALQDGVAIVGAPGDDALGENVGRVFVFSCPGDLNADGAISSADLALLLGQWGTGDPAADLDGSGAVGEEDLALLLAGWGACT